MKTIELPEPEKLGDDMLEALGGFDMNFCLIGNIPVGEMVLTITRLQAAIDEAVEAEREACERVARDESLVLRDGYLSEDRTAANIANAIRARSEGGAA